MEPQNPHASESRQGKKKVHSLLDKVCSRKNLELAWEKVQKNRGSAGIDDVTMAQFEARKEEYLDLLHRKLQSGTYRPKPVKRVEIPKSEGGVRRLGIPAVWDRVCQQALVQRMEPIGEPTFLASAFGYRKGHSPHDAMRKVWQELNAGYGWIVDADLRQCFGAPGQAWRFQRVRFPPRQGERAAPPGIESWAHGGNDMGEASTERRPGRHAREASQPRETIRGPTRAKTWQAPVGNRDGRRWPEPPAGSQSTARTETEASRNLGDPPSAWPEWRLAEYAD